MVIKNLEVLEEDYLPNVLPHRENQIKYLCELIENFVRTKIKVKNILIFGPSGIGKTATIKFVFRELEEKLNAKLIYLNCWNYNTETSALSEILRNLGYPFPRRGVGLDEILEKMREIVKKVEKPIIIALDEIDKIEEINSFLYKLSRSKEFFNSDFLLILISNSKDFLAKLEQRVLSSLKIEEIEFKRYNIEEIKDIIEQRVKLAFSNYDKEILLYIAAQTYKNGSDIRFALKVLKEVALLAIKENANKITLEMVKKVLKEENKNVELNEIEKEIFEKISNIIKASELYENFKEKLTKPSFLKILENLERKGLIKIERRKSWIIYKIWNFMEKIRNPIVTLMGHVDHGKTSLLDAIRGYEYAKLEVGEITQHISCTFVPKNHIEKICGNLLEKFNFKILFDGFLFVDTPGHAAFIHLRKRGGSFADIAILVIDIIEGIKEQTVESIQIIKMFKIPFLIALNKIDKINGWKISNSLSFLESIKSQNERVQYELDKKLYEIVAKLYEYGFNCERFDRVTDFKNQIPIVPISAKTKEGLAELLLIIAGISQIFLKDKLKVEEKNYGSVLEIKEVKGLGKVADCILYSGRIKRGYYIVFGCKEPIISKVKAILVPRYLSDSRFEKHFENVEEVYACRVLRIWAENLENVISGCEFIAVENENEIENAKKELKTIEQIEFKKEIDGIIAKAESIGSLEALIKMLEERKIPIRIASVGKLKKDEILDAELIKNEKYKAILAFNIDISEEEKELLKQKGIKLFQGNIIYKIIEDFENYLKEYEKREIENILLKINRPCVIKVLPDFIFRRSEPAIFGVEVLKGRLFKGTLLKRKDGKIVGKVKDIQKEKLSIPFASCRERVAISIEEAVVGRTFKEDEILISELNEKDIEILKKYFDYLSNEEKELLKEWGIVK